jgi:hypothetical protein
MQGRPEEFAKHLRDDNALNRENEEQDTVL